MAAPSLHVIELSDLDPPASNAKRVDHPPVDDDKDEEKVETRRTWMVWTQERILHTLPYSATIDLQDLRRLNIGMRIAIANIVLFLTLFGFFVGNGTANDMAKKYLALADPGRNVATCEQVRVAVTGVFQADTQGAWSSKRDFNPRLPIYELEMTGSTVSQEEYAAAMGNFSNELQDAGIKQLNYDTISSQILWDVYKAPTNSERRMELKAYTDVSKTFSTILANNVFLSSSSGICFTEQLSADYTAATMTLSLKLFLSQTPSPTSTPTSADGGPAVKSCPDQITLYKDATRLGIFGFNPSSAQNKAFLDMRSAITAFAFNFGLVDDTALTVYKYGPYAGGNFTQYVSSKFPDMLPIDCFTRSGQGFPRVCLAKAGSSTAANGEFSYVYPVFSTSTAKWEGIYYYKAVLHRACQCPRDANDFDCNDGSTAQLTLLFSKTGSVDDTISMGARLQAKMKASRAQGPEMVKQFVSSLGYTTNFKRFVLSRDELEGWKEGHEVLDDSNKDVPLMPFKDFAAGFESLGNSISLLSVPFVYFGNTANLNIEGVELSASFHAKKLNSTKAGYTTQMKTMCQNTIFQADAFANMVAHPPVDVVQPFLTCRPTFQTSFLNAVGIAAGNANLFTSMILAGTLALIVIVHNNLYAKKKTDKAGNVWTKVLAPWRRKVLEKNQLLEENARLSQQVAELASEMKEMKAMRDSLVAKGIIETPPTSESLEAVKHTSQTDFQVRLSKIIDDVPAAFEDNPMHPHIPLRLSVQADK